MSTDDKVEKQYAKNLVHYGKLKILLLFMSIN